MSDETEIKQTRPSWHMKQIGARMVVYAIERFGAGFYKNLAKIMDLNQADLKLVMKEVTSYYDTASLRCPHLEDVDVADFAETLDEAEFKEWSASAKEARKKRR